jgi:hypothetical protein
MFEVLSRQFDCLVGRTVDSVMKKSNSFHEQRPGTVSTLKGLVVRKMKLLSTSAGLILRTE